MRIDAPNGTFTPNAILDYWMARTTPAEFKVLMCIVRKTFGWHKKRDAISLKQIAQLTNLSLKGIRKNIDSLIAKGLVTKIKSKTCDGDDAPNQYEINVYTPEEKPEEGNSVGGGRELSTPRVGNSVPYGVGNSVPPQKKHYTKETITKEEGAKAPPSFSPLVHNFQFGKHVVMKQSELVEFQEEYGEDVIMEYLQQMDDYISSIREKPYKDFAAALRNWIKRDKKNGKGKDVQETNHQFAQRIAENYNLNVAPHMQIKLEAFSDRIEIHSTSPTSFRPGTKIQYKENAFKEQLENALRTWNLK